MGRGRWCRWRACLALACRGHIRERRVGREDHNSANEPRPSTNNQPTKQSRTPSPKRNEQTITEQNTTKATATANTMALLVPDFFDHIFADLHKDVVDLSSCKKVCRPSASRKERYYSAFTRTLPIPKGVDKENISAAYTDGVLTLALPKAPESVPKSIIIA